MSVGVMKDYKLKQRDLRASHTSIIRSGWKSKWMEPYLRVSVSTVKLIYIGSVN